ncbi:unnamed protein product [Prorocentrum cordatum]|uniref:Uncharacterized protein n=1 Tax=Prorocentrum cordatum TaxID=2364126 RepID=A0ABN9QUH6_9DINO|nr:unnamed protein product [Polarella glacialis]
MLAVIVHVLSDADGGLGGGDRERFMAACGSLSIAGAERYAEQSSCRKLDALVQNASCGAKRLLRELLALDPASRPSAQQALQRAESPWQLLLEPALERAMSATNSTSFEAPDEDLLDPSRRAEFLGPLRNCFKEELDACIGGSR